MVLGRGEISAVLLVLGLIVCIYMVLLAGPTSAQDDGGSGPPAGTPVGTQNTDNPASPPNVFTIPAEDCTTVENTGASVTLEESDGTQGRLVDGRGVEIRATPSQIVIEIVNEGDFFSDVAQFPSDDRAFDTGNDITVVTSTNITCAGETGTTTGGETTGGPISARSTPENGVIRRTIPKKPLPPTGGLPVYVMVAGSVLAGTGLLGLGLVVRRGRRG